MQTANPARAALSRAVNAAIAAIAAGSPVYINRPALSEPARAALAYCAAHSPVAQYGDTAGKRVVFFHWPSVADAMGLPSSDPFTLIWEALQELHRAGLLAYHDHGPGAYGQASTIYLGE